MPTTKDAARALRKRKKKLSPLAAMKEREGIEAIKAHPSHSSTSIGRDRKGRWWGWSHRAATPFAKGDRIFEEDYEPQGDKTPFREHGRKVIKTDADARLAATRFARYVS